MKKIYSILLLAFTILGGSTTYAQCSSCTLTITGADASNHIVSAGTTLCISASGNATGLILVDGGTLCNQGTINTTNIAVINGGVFNNYGNATIDSLWVTNPSSIFTNWGTLTGYNMAVTNQANILNHGTTNMDLVADSAASLSNYNSLTINFDFGTSYSALVNNHGNMSIGRDFYSSNSSTFYNDVYLYIGRDFLNSTSAVVTTECMVNVGRDWLNSSIVNGSSSGACGGFAMAGNSYNSGTVGSSTQHVDLCDAGHPGTGIDWNGGTIASTTTYCTCSYACTTIGIVDHQLPKSLEITPVFPNPANQQIGFTVKATQPMKATVEILDMSGKRRSVQTISMGQGENTATIRLDNIASGNYILNVSGSDGSNGKQLFTVSH